MFLILHGLDMPTNIFQVLLYTLFHENGLKKFFLQINFRPHGQRTAVGTRELILVLSLNNVLQNVA